MSSLRLLALLELLAVARGSLTYRATNNASKECDCYRTDGVVPEVFTDHAFFDFRSLNQYANVPDAADSYEEAHKAPYPSDFFKTEEWNSTWGVQNWGNAESKKSVTAKGDATIDRTNSFGNVYIEKNKDKNADSDTYLTMRTKRFKDFQSAAAFESRDLYYHVSIRMLARMSGDPGAVLAMFTYRDPEGGKSEEVSQVQEADIEVLTKGPQNRISYTNQPSLNKEGNENPEATRNATLPGGKKWTEWIEHRFDWTPEMSTWYLDGEKIAKIGYQAPRDPSQLVFNAWSDGGSWSGVMPVGGSAYMQIKWIEMVYNTTTETREDVLASKRRARRSNDGQQLFRRQSGETCKNVCSIDENADVGRPAKVKGGVERLEKNNVATEEKESGALRVVGSVVPAVLVTGAVAFLMG